MRILTNILLITLLAYVSLPTVALVMAESLEIVCTDDVDNDLKVICFVEAKNIVTKADFIKIYSKIISKNSIKNQIFTSKIIIPPPDLI